MNLQNNIRRILKEELSPRVRRRISYEEMEKEFLESFESAYDLTKRRKVLSTHFLDELIYTTITMMMDGVHWRFVSTLPEDEFWYDDIHTELENHYRDRIKEMYNEKRGIKESIKRILREESKIPLQIRRRVDINDFINHFDESLDYASNLYRKNKAKFNAINSFKFVHIVISHLISEVCARIQNKVCLDYFDELWSFLSDYFNDEIQQRFYDIKFED